MKRAVVLIVTDIRGRVLLLKRGPEHKHFPGQWCLPGGKVDQLSTAYGGRWESDDEACIRECIEETGYVPSLIEDTHRTAIGSDKQFIVRIFKCLDKLPHKSAEDYSSIITRSFPNGEHTEYGLFDPRDLPADIGNLTRKIITQSL